MASNFIISTSQENEADWFPSGGVYDQTFDGVLFELAAIDKPLAESLKDEVSIGYGSIDEVSDLEFNNFLVAAQHYYQREIHKIRQEILTGIDRAGHIEDHFSQPVIFPVGQLIAMLRADDRVFEHDRRLHKFDFGDGVTLDASAWIVDFILELLATDSRLLRLNRSLSDQLLNQRFSEAVVIPLSSINSDEFCAILNAATLLSRIYAVSNKGMYGYSSRFTPQIHQKVIELAKMLQEHKPSDCINS